MDTDGDGASQLTLARILHTLREPRDNARTLYAGGVIPVKPYCLDELARHGVFMLSPEDQISQQVLAAARAEAVTIFKFEKRPRVVTAWQRYIEPHIQTILKNK